MRQKTADIIFRTAQLVTGIALLINTSRAIYNSISAGVPDSSMFFVALMTASAFSLVHVPGFVRRRDWMVMPAALQTSFVIFATSAMFFGKVVGFYIFFPWWDLMLHLAAGVMFALTGYVLYVSLNRRDTDRASVNPAFVVLFAVCFSIMASALWEVFEFMMDSLTNMNMQGWHNDYTAEQWLALHNASNQSNPGLIDTMTDVISGIAGALLSIPLVLRLSRVGNRYTRSDISSEELSGTIWRTRE